MSACAVVVFTRDLRVRDNPALSAACREADTVVPLFVLVVLAVVQVGLALHVRSTLASAAAEGARVAAVSGGDTAAGVARTRSALATSLADGVATGGGSGRGVTTGVATTI